MKVRGLAVLAVASAVLLTGCGAVPDLNPGVAARVGDETVTTGTVRDVADDYCASVEPRLQGQAIARSQLNGRVVSSLALRSAADQLLAGYGATADASYDKAVESGLQQLQTQFPDLSEADRDATVQVEAASVYVSAAEMAVGQIVVPGSSGDAAVAAGKKEFESWLDDHDVRIDPRYGVSIDGGEVADVDTALSFAVSDTATTAAAADPDQVYAAGLPETQRCG